MNLEANNRSFFPNTWSHWLYNGGQISPLILIANTSTTSIWKQPIVTQPQRTASAVG